MRPSDEEELVLEIVARIPSGQVLTYGDIAQLVGRGGPRGVGAVMSRWGSGVPWWRVLRAGGYPPMCHEAEALRHYREEGTALIGGALGGRVDLRRARWTPSGGELEQLLELARTPSSMED